MQGDRPTGDIKNLRLCPEMASFRGLVLAFVRDYIERFGVSPSYGEIAAGVHGGTKDRARDAVRSLVRDQLLYKVPGPRGLRLPTEIEEARRILKDAGEAPDFPLLPPAALTYPSDRAQERGAEEQGIDPDPD